MAREGCIHLKYLDESGFALLSVLNYSWSKVGKRKCIVQPKKRGRRINVLGVWEPGKRFEYGMSLGSIKGATFLKFMEWQAGKAAAYKESERITVIGMDNYSLPKRKLVRAEWETWQRQSLYIFFLPPYSPALNRIEDEWGHIRKEDRGGRVYDYEDDLTTGVELAFKQRYQQRGIALDKYVFN